MVANFKMEDLNIRFDRIRHAITAELNENSAVTQRGDSISKNINYQRRALYSEIELFKMELEELIGGNEVAQAQGKDDDDEKVTVKKEKKSISVSGGSPIRSRSDITSPLMNRMDSISSSNSYVDGNRSNNTGYNNTYNDVGNQSSTDRDRLLSDTTGAGTGINTGINTGKYIVISEDDADETKISSRSSSEKNQTLIQSQKQKQFSNSPAAEGYKKNVLQKNHFGIFSEAEHSEILRMIEECSSISGRFGLNFAHRDPKW